MVIEIKNLWLNEWMKPLWKNDIVKAQIHIIDMTTEPARTVHRYFFFFFRKRPYRGLDLFYITGNRFLWDTLRVPRQILVRLLYELLSGITSAGRFDLPPFIYLRVMSRTTRPPNPRLHVWRSHLIPLNVYEPMSNFTRRLFPFWK